MAPTLARSGTTSWMYDWGNKEKETVADEVGETPRQYDALFKEFDADGSGQIDLDELTAALAKGGKQLDRAECEKILKEVDTDGDGKVSYEEFEVIFKRSPDALPVGLKHLVDAGNLLMRGLAAPVYAGVDMWNWTTKAVSFDTTPDVSDATPKNKPALSRRGSTSWMYNWGANREAEEPAEAEEATPPPAKAPAMLSRRGSTSWMYDWGNKQKDTA